MTKVLSKLGMTVPYTEKEIGETLDIFQPDANPLRGDYLQMLADDTGGDTITPSDE